jgi:hypothetical protein
MSASLSHFAFQGDDLEVITSDGAVHVGVRAVCEALGVSYQGQIEKLKSDPAVGLKMILIPSRGGQQDTACIPLRALPLWLATIHPSKVKPAVREKLTRYKREAAEVLADHFLGPRVAPPPPPPALGRPLTRRQEEILDFMRTYARSFGSPPTIREIAAHFGFTSTNGVHDHLVAMERKGAIKLRADGKARGIILPPEPASASLVPASAAPPADDARIDRLERLVEQLVGALATLAANPPRRRHAPALPGQRPLPFPSTAKPSK